MKFSLVSSLTLLVAVNEAKNTQPNLQARSFYNPKRARQLPADPVGVKTITTPQNVTIRYKEPGKEGVCETTPGVNSYSGYIDLDVRSAESLRKSEKSLTGFQENSHTFFWFFEARNNPKEAPVTLV